MSTYQNWVISLSLRVNYGRYTHVTANRGTSPPPNYHIYLCLLIGDFMILGIINEIFTLVSLGILLESFYNFITQQLTILNSGLGIWNSGFHQWESTFIKLKILRLANFSISKQINNIRQHTLEESKPSQKRN